MNRSNSTSTTFNFPIGHPLQATTQHTASTCFTPKATTPDIPKEPQLTKEELEKSEWLDQQVKEKILDHYAEDVFRENIPGIREQGEPIEAIPTPPGIKPPTRGLGRYSKQDKEELDKQIADLLHKGLIEPSLSPYAAAALIVPKYLPDGSIKGWRLVIDYRLLNMVTIKYQFPPSMELNTFHHVMQLGDFGKLSFIRVTNQRQPFAHRLACINGEYSRWDCPILLPSFKGPCHPSSKRHTLTRMIHRLHRLQLLEHSCKCTWTIY